MSVLQSIVYFYRSQCFEQQNDLKTFREELMEAYRLSCINKQEVLQAMLYNLILRNYLNYNNYEAANHFLNKTSFPESVQNNEFTKYPLFIKDIYITLPKSKLSKWTTKEPIPIYCKLLENHQIIQQSDLKHKSINLQSLLSYYWEKSPQELYFLTLFSKISN